MFFKFIGILLIVALLFFLLVGVLFGRVIKFFNPSSNENRSKQRSTNNQYTQKEKVTKKFSKNEGEYVSYEEIKDEE